MLLSYYFKAMKWMNFFLFCWFLFFFSPHWLGWLISLVISYRLFKQWFNPRKTSAFGKLVDCSHFHSTDDGHKHIGKAPDKHGHVHSKVHPDVVDKHARHHRP